MEIFRTASALREWIETRRNSGTSIGFVPTMGYLHEGHCSLLRASNADNGMTVLSIFVNPLQFGPNEDFERYPRDEQRDLEMAAAAGTDAVFLPDVQEMYPHELRITMKVSGLSDMLCGASRPGHFDGVATVVMKLLQIVRPDRAYFGLKDAQQVAVIEQMVADFNVPVTVVPCPTLREEDGLALSSRNVYLSEEERDQALALNRSLRKVQEIARTQPKTTIQEAVLRAREEINRQPLAVIDYVEAVAWPSLEVVPSGMTWAEADGSVLLALAVKFGRTRLIDNVIID